MDYEKKYKDLVEAVKTLKEANPSDEGIQNWVNDNVPELKESEDERIRKAVIEMIHDTPNVECEENYNVRKEDVLAWLEKQREQILANSCKTCKDEPFNYEKANIQQKDFAPNAEEMKELLRTEYEKGKYDAIAEMQGEQKSQRIISAEAKEAMYGKPAWSEEDESRMNDMCHFLNEYGDQYYGGLTLQGTITWLKSLKDRVQPQSQWKPSNEQMTALRRMKAAIAGEGEIYKPLNSLYEDLKKLREE